MATSPSDPYKSRIVRGVVRQARRLLDRSQRTIRQVQVAASWSAQILLYPVYAVFQSGRWVGKKIEQAQQTTQLRELEPTLEVIPLTKDGAEFTSSTPIQHVLQTVQKFELPACSVAIHTPVAIRAIASLLASKALVLVTNHNQILEIADSQQQTWLKQRIVYEIALFNRQYRSQRSLGQRLQRVITGLRSTFQQRLSPAPPSPSSLAGEHRTSLVPLALTSDLVIQRSLQVVSSWLVTAETPSLKLSDGSAIAQTDASTPVPTSTIQIRGVASLLSPRRLVLVAEDNQVLDILTSAQQHHLQQRIAWEVATYRRYLGLKHQSNQLVPLHPAAQSQLLLKPVQAFQALMTWMQSGAVAVTVNLFREASWLPRTFPSTKLFNAALRLPQPQPYAAAQNSLTLANSEMIAPAPSAQILIQPSSIDLTSKNLATNTPALEVASHAHRLALDSYPASNANYVDTEVTWVDYEYSWLERLMRWLDHCFLWFETVITTLWKALKRI
jgi:hypothetical protein